MAAPRRARAEAGAQWRLPAGEAAGGGRGRMKGGEERTARRERGGGCEYVQSGSFKTDTEPKKKVYPDLMIFTTRHRL